MKKAAVLFTGGKDSCLALHLAKLEGYDIRYLLTIFPCNFDSFMFHKPCLQLLEKQAEMLDIDLVIAESEGVKEEEVDDLKKLIKKVSERNEDEVDVIIAGGIASSYQGKRVERVCEELGLEFYSPLWNYKEGEVWDKLLKEGFQVILIKISCEGLGKEWLGKVIDRRKFAELKKLSEKYKFRLDFEGGEAESAVLGMPGFKKTIKIDYDIKSEGKYRHFLDIRRVV